MNGDWPAVVARENEKRDPLPWFKSASTGLNSRDLAIMEATDYPNNIVSYYDEVGELHHLSRDRGGKVTEWIASNPVEE